MNSSSIIVLGHFCWDGFQNQDGSVNFEPGGIAWSLYALSSVMEKQDRIFPVFPVEADSIETVKAELKQLPFLVTDGIYQSDEKNDRVQVIQKAGGELSYLLVQSSEQSISMNHLPDLEPAAVYVNFHTGYDLQFSDLKLIRQKYPSAFIHVNLHVKAERLFTDFRNNPDGMKAELSELFSQINSVQVTQREMQMLFLAAGLTEKGILKLAMIDGKVDFVLINKGDRGVVAWEKVLNSINSHILRPFSQTENPSSVGCGDILGSVYTYQMIKTKSLKLSLQKAMKLAELAAGKTGFARKVEHMRINGALL
ncbi:MAG: PfkB family carbohydrate kinase [Bacteroidetes bacterium]|nr:PfkB family carbohydrate kinase [Bacteroidota bacterium]